MWTRVEAVSRPGAGQQAAHLAVLAAGARQHLGHPDRAPGLYLEEKEEVGKYTLMFDHLRVQALSRDESRALIMRVAQDLI